MGLTPIVFDLDGTLWDATKQIADCYSKELQVTTEEIRSVMGKSSSEIASLLGVPLQRLEYLQQLEVVYLKDNPGQVYSGVVEVLEELFKRGHQLYLVSNCQSGYIETFLDNVGITNLFYDYLCEGSTNLSKHQMLSYLKHKYQLHNPIYVGDTLNDKISSEQAGYKFIGVSYGFGGIDGLTELSELLNLMQD